MHGARNNKISTFDCNLIIKIIIYKKLTALIQEPFLWSHWFVLHKDVFDLRRKDQTFIVQTLESVSILSPNSLTWRRSKKKERTDKTLDRKRHKRSRYISFWWNRRKQTKPETEEKRVQKWSSPHEDLEKGEKPNRRPVHDVAINYKYEHI